MVSQGRTNKPTMKSNDRGKNKDQQTKIGRKDDERTREEGRKDISIGCLWVSGPMTLTKQAKQKESLLTHQCRSVRFSPSCFHRARYNVTFWCQIHLVRLSNQK